MPYKERYIEVVTILPSGAERRTPVPIENFGGNGEGVPGPKGDKGDPGRDGIDGAPGQDGAPGADGQDGATGPQGLKGDKGDTGSQGIKGDTGLTGPQGTTGAQGVKGDTGAQGVKGDTGAQGVKGDTGAQGQQGIQGTAGVDGVRTATTAFGYATGAGGTVTQATSKSTGVTLSKLTGQITMNAAALAAGAVVSFVLTNTTIAATDIVVTNHAGAGTLGPYLINARAASGSATIAVRNTSAASLSEAIVIGFAVIKAVTA